MGTGDLLLEELVVSQLRLRQHRQLPPIDPRHRPRGILLQKSKLLLGERFVLGSRYHRKRATPIITAQKWVPMCAQCSPQPAQRRRMLMVSWSQSDAARAGSCPASRGPPDLKPRLSFLWPLVQQQQRSSSGQKLEASRSQEKRRGAAHFFTTLYSKLTSERQVNSPQKNASCGPGRVMVALSRPIITVATCDFL